MKIVVLARRGSVVHRAEDAVAGFKAGGHDVRFDVTRDPFPHRTIEKVLLAWSLGAPRAAGSAYEAGLIQAGFWRCAASPTSGART
jgi:hypothetical protein